MITRHTTKSCCGSKSLIFETDKPVRKSQVQLFKDKGYFVPDNFLNVGIFYAKKGLLVATGSFGGNRLDVKCSGEQVSALLDEFQADLEEAIQIK